MSGANKNSVWYLYPKYKYSKSTGDYKNAIFALETLYGVQNIELRESMRQSASVSERNYFKEKESDTSDKFEIFKIITLMSVLCAVVLIVSVFFIYSTIRKEKYTKLMLAFEDIKKSTDTYKTSNEELIRSNEELKNERRLEIKNMQSYLSNLLNAQIPELDNILTEFTDPNTEPDRKLVEAAMKKILLSLQSKDYLDKMLQLTNETHDGLASKIQKEMPDLSERDVYFISLIAMGFSPASVSAILKFSVSNFYSLKSRIKKKVSTSSAQVATSVLKVLSR